MQCPNCHAENNGSSPYCSECGSPLHAQQNQQPYQQPYQQQYQQPYTQTPPPAGPQYAPPQYVQPGQPVYAVPVAPVYPYQVISPSNRWIAFALCFFLGVIGIHRFYVGKVGTGILYILTAGLCGIGVLVDLIMIVCGSFTDKAGLPLKN